MITASTRKKGPEHTLVCQSLVLFVCVHRLSPLLTASAWAEYLQAATSSLTGGAGEGICTCSTGNSWYCMSRLLIHHVSSSGRPAKISWSLGLGGWLKLDGCCSSRDTALAWSLLVLHVHCTHALHCSHCQLLFGSQVLMGCQLGFFVPHACACMGSVACSGRVSLHVFLLEHCCSSHARVTLRLSQAQWACMVLLLYPPFFGVGGSAFGRQAA
jgi:hypothetical protein